jgi:hypothetical protein
MFSVATFPQFMCHVRTDGFGAGTAARGVVIAEPGWRLRQQRQRPRPGRHSREQSGNGPFQHCLISWAGSIYVG